MPEMYSQRYTDMCQHLNDVFMECLAIAEQEQESWENKNPRLLTHKSLSPLNKLAKALDNFEAIALNKIAWRQHGL